ncbi:hypothetical protein LTR66_009047 [Elasticomyces elasticus]|nr:hypothetical protein LTR66_009047 [Elasticomyces elasticus]
MCVRSFFTTHPNPVVLLHGLGANQNEDLNYLETYLQSQSYCTFSLTYGAFPQYPEVGGLRFINESAPQVASFIQEVHTNTGATKIDVVGHSEGAFQSLYMPKFNGISGIVDKIVAIAPPTHGTTFGGIYAPFYLLGNLTIGLADEILNTVGCPACGDLVTGGAAVQRLNDGAPIVQSGNTLTVIASKDDELVTPTTTAFVNEAGVSNMYVQETYPLDPVGHIGEAYDTNVWNLVVNALNTTPKRAFACSFGSPGKL